MEWPVEGRAPTMVWLAERRGESLRLRRLVRLATDRRQIEQDCRALKNELGLAHFEDCAWTERHHHATLASMAYAFWVLDRVRAEHPSPTTLPQIRRQFQRLRLRLGDQCSWHGLRVRYDTSRLPVES